MGTFPTLNPQIKRMTKRIRIILISVFISIICIIILQAYWIHNSYSVNRNQILKELNLAFEESVKQEINERSQSVTKTVYQNHLTSIGSSHQDEKTIQHLDSIFNEIQQDTSLHANLNLHLEAPQDSSELAESDLLPNRVEFYFKDVIYSMLQQELDDDFMVNTSRIDTIFTQNISQRNLSLTHYIEVVNKRKDSLIFTSAQFTTDTLNSILSRPIIASITGKQFVRVRIPNVQQVILRKMIGSIFASLLLILLVLACFLYMLNTIFKQKELSEVKNDFINNMTHELKTPIATVSAAVEAMQNFGVLENKEKTENYLKISGQELMRLSGLVEKVLRMASEERKPLPLNIEKLDFRLLCDTIIQNQRMTTKNKHLTIEFESSITNCTLKADRFHLSNLIQNLIDNSIKYSGDKVDVKIEYQKKDPHCIICVSDNGMGIPKHCQAHIFDQFYRVPTGNQHNSKGFGLGLHYVKTIVQKHGGTISVQSTINKGTKFTIQLPV